MHWVHMPPTLRGDWRKAVRAGTLDAFQAHHPEIDDWSPLVPGEPLPPAARWWRGSTPVTEPWDDDPDTLAAMLR